MSTRLPIFLDLTGRRILVVGAGRAAARKLPALLDAGAAVTVIAPKVTETVRRLLQPAPTARLIRRNASADDVSAEYTLLFPLTDDTAFNRQLAVAARAARVLVAGSADAERGDFHMGAVVDRGAIRLAVSTGAVSPALAGLLAEVLRRLLPESLDGDVAVLRRERRRITQTLNNATRRQAALLQAVGAPKSNLEETI